MCPLTVLSIHKWVFKKESKFSYFYLFGNGAIISYKEQVAATATARQQTGVEIIAIKCAQQIIQGAAHNVEANLAKDLTGCDVIRRGQGTQTSQDRFHRAHRAISGRQEAQFTQQRMDG